MGEGGGALILEALEHAEARGATPLAELVGYGATADASHITLPAPGGIGATRAARRALDKAGMEPAEIDHVNAHATSTPEGDKAELQSIRTIFGDHAPSVAVTANKSMLGHTLGAAGAIEAIATIHAIREGCIPPTINLDDPDARGHRPRPHAQRGVDADRAGRDVQLVRVRRPEHGARVPAVGRMSAPTDEGREEEPMTERGVADERGFVDPVAVGPGEDAADAAGDGPAVSRAEPPRTEARRRPPRRARAATAPPERPRRRPRWPAPTPRCSRWSTA